MEWEEKERGFASVDARWVSKSERYTIHLTNAILYGYWRVSLWKGFDRVSREFEEKEEALEYVEELKENPKAHMVAEAL